MLISEEYQELHCKYSGDAGAGCGDDLKVVGNLWMFARC